MDRKHNSRIAVWTLVIAGAAAADLTVSNTSARRDITGPWDIAGTVTFSGTAKPYGTGNAYIPSSWEYGLHFLNGSTTAVSNRFQGSPCIVLGVDGANTAIRYAGYLQADGESYVNVSLTRGGRLILTPDAHLDLVNSAYYTRQMWFLGDGTGQFEVEEGFVADRTSGGTVPDGVASYRFSKTTFISHHTQGLPTNGFPKCLNCPVGGQGYNGHLVFENAGPSRWIVKTNDQVYRAAVWCWANAVIETQKNLTHTGFRVQLQSQNGTTTYNYLLAGAFQTLSNDLTITKEGPAALNLEGEQAYKPGTIMDIRNGTVNFRCDATGGWFRPGETQGGQDLAVTVRSGAAAAFSRAALIRIKSLELAADGAVTIETGTRAEMQSSKLAGTLHIKLKPGSTAKAGDSFTLFKWGTRSGQFSSVVLPAGGTWDTSKLYTDGVITLTNGTVDVGIRPAQDVVEGGEPAAASSAGRGSVGVDGRVRRRDTAPSSVVVPERSVRLK